MCQYIVQKKNSAVWYYRRRIPAYAQKLYAKAGAKAKKAELFFSLQTTDAAVAAKKADQETRKLDALWSLHKDRAADIADPGVSLARLKAAGLSPGDGKVMDDEGLSLPQIDAFREAIIGFVEQGERPAPLSDQDKLTLDILQGALVPKTLRDARELHTSLGKGPKNKIAQGQSDRAWNLLYEITGNKIITNIRRSEANEFVARLIERGQSAETVRKYIAQIAPVLKLAIREFELDWKNHFEGLQIANKGEEPRHERLPYTQAQLRTVQSACREKDDSRRWLIAALSDTGARLSELLGMEQADVFLDAPIPYIHIRPNDTRRLKTEDSERQVPLVGETLWAVRRAMESASEHLFPSLLPKARGIEFDSGSASAALGKWLKDNGLAGKGQALHSFRHTMADRLRNAGVSKELLEAIGGWATGGMSSGYGKGFSLETKREAMTKVVG